jgi:hypothetical protein
MAAIDAALAKNPKLSAEQMAAVKKDRADGEALHKAGKHAESLVAYAGRKRPSVLSA